MGVGVGVEFSLKSEPAAWMTKAWNDARSLTEPVYLRPLTMTVGVPVTFSMLESGMGLSRARCVELETYALNSWFLMHETILSGCCTAACVVRSTSWSSEKPAVFSAGWLPKRRLWKS